MGTNFCLPVLDVLSFKLDETKSSLNEDAIVELLSSIDDFFVFLDSNCIKLDDETITHSVGCATNFLVEVFALARSRGWTIENIRTLIPNIWNIHRKSSFIRHLQDWPKGYPGDYQIVNMIIDRTEKKIPQKDLGNFLGKYGLDSLIAQQHREKIEEQSNAIKEVCEKTDNACIASIACGPSRDVENVLYFIKNTNAKIVLIDFDQDALNESAKRLSSVKDNVNCILTDIRKIPKLFKELTQQNGQFDLIYAGGLFDYLPDGIIQLLVNQLSTTFIKEGGSLMFTNIADHNPYKDWIEVLGNWNLIDRDEETMRRFLSYSSFRQHVLYKEKTGLTWIAKAINS